MLVPPTSTTRILALELRAEWPTEGSELVRALCLIAADFMKAPALYYERFS
jgi:hypothetical protein